jgi:hypothetical protein
MTLARCDPSASRMAISWVRNAAEKAIPRGAEDDRLRSPTASTASLAWNRQPGVKYGYSRRLKVFYIPRDHGHAVDQGRRSNQGVPF